MENEIAGIVRSEVALGVCVAMLDLFKKLEEDCKKIEGYSALPLLAIQKSSIITFERMYKFLDVEGKKVVFKPLSEIEEVIREKELVNKLPTINLQGGIHEK